MSMSRVTCEASSRVGTTTRACGLPSPGESILCRIGTVKPIVLPVPVRAWPMRSWSLIASGMASAWIGNGLMMLCAASASTMSSATPRSAKVFCNGLPRRAETVVQWCVGARTRRSRGPKRGLRVNSCGGGTGLGPHRDNSLAGFAPPGVRVPPMAEWTDPMTDDDRREALLDLLGVLAYGELIAFERLADDARLAPTVSDKAALGAMAVAEFGHFRKLRDRITELGADAGKVMGPFVEPLDAFHDSTAPADWLEGLVKAYVGDGIAADFYREVAAYVDDDSRDLVLDVLADTGHAAFAVEHVRGAIAADPAVAGRLALWARRLVGEALVQAQRVAVDRDALARLIVGGTGDLAAVGELLARLTQRHAERMAALGLAA